MFDMLSLDGSDTDKDQDYACAVRLVLLLQKGCQDMSLSPPLTAHQASSFPHYIVF